MIHGSVQFDPDAQWSSINKHQNINVTNSMMVLMIKQRLRIDHSGCDVARQLKGMQWNQWILPDYQAWLGQHVSPCPLVTTTVLNHSNHHPAVRCWQLGPLDRGIPPGLDMTQLCPVAGPWPPEGRQALSMPIQIPRNKAERMECFTWTRRPSRDRIVKWKQRRMG